MNLDNDYDNDGNNIVPCPLCLSAHCASKEGGKCPEEKSFLAATKILFLDIDGVVNCSTTTQRHRGFIGIDPYMAFLVGKITLEVPDLKVVLSSSWRTFHDDGVQEVSKQVVPIFDVTPNPWYDKLTSHHSTRGEEIQAWLDQHPEVERYAILDDDTRLLPNQLPNFFQTYWSEGITEETMQKVIDHFKVIHNTSVAA